MGILAGQIQSLTGTRALPYTHLHPFQCLCPGLQHSNGWSLSSSGQLVGGGMATFEPSLQAQNMLHFQNINSPITLLKFQDSNHRSLKLQAAFSWWCSPANGPSRAGPPRVATFIIHELPNVHGPVSGFLFCPGSVCLFGHLRRVLCQREGWSQPRAFFSFRA